MNVFDKLARIKGIVFDVDGVFTDNNILITDQGEFLRIMNVRDGYAIKRAIAPLLANAFPQFPNFTNITLGETAEDGTTSVILKQPRQVEAKVDSPIQSLEPLVVTEPDPVPAAPDYVEPEA